MSVTDEMDRVFKALANADRRHILDIVRKCPLKTKSICEELPHLDRTTVMLHLRVLEKADLIIVQREGRVRWNHLNAAPIQNIYTRWIKRYSEPAAKLLTKLKNDLESTPRRTKSGIIK